MHVKTHVTCSVNDLQAPRTKLRYILYVIFCNRNRVKQSFVIFDIWALWRSASAMSVRVPKCQKLQMSTHNWALWRSWLRLSARVSGCQKFQMTA